jgi:Pentapeptide repeats (8 copies)
LARQDLRTILRKQAAACWTARINFTETDFTETDFTETDFTEIGFTDMSQFPVNKTSCKTGPPPLVDRYGADSQVAAAEATAVLRFIINTGLTALTPA